MCCRRKTTPSQEPQSVGQLNGRGEEDGQKQRGALKCRGRGEGSWPQPGHYRAIGWQGYRIAWRNFVAAQNDDSRNGIK